MPRRHPYRDPVILVMEKLLQLVATLDPAERKQALDYVAQRVATDAAAAQWRGDRPGDGTFQPAGGNLHLIKALDARPAKGLPP
jgi:hypothetical protein